MVSHKPEDHQLVCVGREYTPHMEGRKGLLVLAPDVEANAPGAENFKVPIESNFLKNPVNVAKDLFAALDKMPKPGVVACASGRRARIVVAAWAAARNGGDADAAVSHLEATGDCKADVAHWVRGAVAANTAALTNPLVFRQLFEKESSTYTYLLGDAVTREAILIDPVDLTVERDIAVIEGVVTSDGKQGLKLTKGLNTHCHADHITGTAGLKGKVPSCKSIISKDAGAKADVLVSGGDRITFGKRFVEVIPTPGHTNGCVSFVMDDRSMVFTGDALLIRGCGRTDFQQGDSHVLYKSVTEGLFVLPADCLVYPAHDYQGRSNSSISEERVVNARLGEGKTEEQFVAIMKNLNLPYPKKIDASLPANLLCGYPDDASWKAAATA
mmetsp:Transcript_11766/g.28692  ORF Transcript_11766/g.28692 Transcript_11766/m.28692 type:complete len:385 (+) Transcript_11766:76-1230(+)